MSDGVDIEEVRALLARGSESSDLDYKEKLTLETAGDKATFVKDVLSIANSAAVGYIVTGVQDKTWTPVGARAPVDSQAIYQILRNKSDPPVSVKYAEFEVDGNRHGVLSINGENPPYIVSVPDKFGGSVSKSRRVVHIYRGTIFVRNNDNNDGILRSQLDALYHQASFELEAIARRDGHRTVVSLAAHNNGRQLARNVQIIVEFTNVERVIKTTGSCREMSRANEGRPIVGVEVGAVHPQIRTVLGDIHLDCHSARTVTGGYTIRGENLLPEDIEFELPIALPKN